MPPISIVVALVASALGALMLWRAYVADRGDGAPHVPAEPPSPPVVDLVMDTPTLIRAADAYTFASTAAGVFACTAAVLWQADKDGVLTSAVGRGLEVYGVRESDILGTNMADWPDSDLWREAVARLAEGIPWVTYDAGAWLRPSRCTIALHPSTGGYIGVAIPMMEA